METKQPYYWLNEEASEFLKRGYLLPLDTPKKRVSYVCKYVEEYYDKLCGGKEYNDIFSAQEFEEYMSLGFYSWSSPIWSNMGLKRGLPISCYGVFIPDSVEGISIALSEVIMQTKYGGGTSGYFGGIRPRGTTITDNGKADGSFPFARLYDTAIDVISQGTSRKGMFAGYMDIEHADVEEWLNIHQPGNPIQLMYYGLCISNQWLEEMKAGDTHKRNVWAKVLQARRELGHPYLFFTDNVNNNKPQVYKDLNMKIHASNLCTEIMLPSSDEESFICCLMSMNLENYDTWKNTKAVKMAVLFLDAVLQEFIDKTEGLYGMHKTNAFAKRHRAIGLGVLGWHTYLQNNMIPFDSYQAMMKNAEIFKYLNEESYKASEELGDRFGYAPIFNSPDVTDKPRRNSTLLSVAPTKSSSFILGQVSSGIEPIKSNYHAKDLAKMLTGWRNPALVKILDSMDKNTEEVWTSILNKNGSVQHLDFLSQDIKDVFKTFLEISQLSIIQQAAQRQRYIDQGQSVNLMIHKDESVKEINKLYLTAAELGIKSLYYQINVNAAQELNRNLVTCSSCES